MESKFYGAFVLNLRIDSMPSTRRLLDGVAMPVPPMHATHWLISTQVMAGSESDARNNGLLFFGGWAAISVVARNAGLMSGQYAVPCLAWNAACAAYSVLA